MSENLPIQGRITNKAGRGDKPRYIRPVERQRMRPWLIAHLDTNDIPGLAWQNKREKVFRISWKHAANQCFNMQKDTNLFERWAVHTGRHHDSDHKRWKANFRCALNSLPDVVEHKDQGIKKGNNAFKVYRFLDEKETKVNKETKGKRKKESPLSGNILYLTKSTDSLFPEPPDGEAEEDTGYKDHSYAEDQLEGGGETLGMPRLEHLNLSTGLRLNDAQLEDPNLQEILAAATASLAAGSDAGNLEKISIEQLSRLGELSRMRLDKPQSVVAPESFMYAFLCSWCDKVFPSKIEIFKHFLMSHQARLLAGETYVPSGGGPDTSDPKYQKLQKEIEVLEKEVFSFTRDTSRDTYQSPDEDDDNEEELEAITSTSDAENQVLDLSVKSKGYQPAKQEVALDLSMSGTKRHKSPKTVQGKGGTKKRRSSLEIDYTVKFGNYGLAGTPRTKRQMSLHLRKKEEEEEKIAKKMSADADSADASAKHSVEDLVHAEILMSLKSGPGDEAESSTDSTSVKSKKDVSKGKKGKAAQKKHLMHLEKVIEDVAKRGADADKDAEESEKGKKSDTKLKFKAFRCGLCLQRFNDSAVLNKHVQDHKNSPIIRLKLDPVAQPETAGYMYYRQMTAGKVQTIWKCQIASSTGPSNIYVCGICQMKFDSLGAIGEHEKVHVQSNAETEAKVVGTDKTVEQSDDTKHKEVEVETSEVENSEEVENVEHQNDETEENIVEISLNEEDVERMDVVENVSAIVEIVDDEQEGSKQPDEHDVSKQLDAVDGDVETENGQETNTEVVEETETVEEMITNEAVHEEIVTVESTEELVVPSANELLASVVPTEANSSSEDVNETNQMSLIIADVKTDAKAFEDPAEVKPDDKDGNENTEMEEDKQEKTKILQCNVPTFLEVSSSAEGYGIKEEDKKELEGDKKAATLQFVNCGICNDKLKLHEVKVHLENHDAEVDIDGKLFEPCIICKKMIPTKDGNEHLKSHSVFELSLAKNILVHNQNQLKKQLVVHKTKEGDGKVDKGENIKMFVCNWCNRGFEDVGPLAEHVKQHLKTADEDKADERRAGGKFDGGIVLDVKDCPEIKGKKRKTRLSDDGGAKKTKLVEEPSVSATTSPSFTDTGLLEEEQKFVEETLVTKKQAAAVIESDPKKNSLLAAALSTAPKYGPIPRTMMVANSSDTIPTSVSATAASKVSATSTACTVGNLSTLMNIPGMNTSLVSSAASLLSLSGLASSGLPTEAGSKDSAEASSLRDSLCLKFPLVLLKPGNESDNSKTESTENASNQQKQSSLSVPVMLVRQENQELKLVPVSSVLGLTSSGKVSDASGSFLKLTSPMQTATIAGKKSVVEVSPGAAGITVSGSITKPPILYAPVSTTKGGVGVTTKHTAQAFPVGLFTNCHSSKLGTDAGKALEQRQVFKSMSDVMGFEIEGKAVTTGQIESKTESQNIIAKLLDSKSKLTNTAMTTPHVTQGNSETKLSTSELQKQSLLQIPSVHVPAWNLTASQFKDQLIQGNLETRLTGSDQQKQSLLQLSSVHVPAWNQSATQTTAGQGTTPMKLFMSTPTLSTSSSAAQTLTTVIPSKLGRPPIHGNKSLVIPAQQVSLPPKAKIITMEGNTNLQVSPSTGQQANVTSLKQIPVPLSSVTPTTTVQKSASGIQVATTMLASGLTTGVQLQPNLVNMMLQQFILSQASQGTGTTSTSSVVTSPKPTFNLVFAPQVAASVPTPATPNVTTPSPTTPVTQVQLPTTSTSGTSQLMLVCKICNQSLDSLGLMGSHVCSIPKPTAIPYTVAGTHKKITLYKCNMCKDATFTDYTMYVQHAKTHPEKMTKTAGQDNSGARKPFLTCPICSKFFKEEAEMTRHIEENHFEENIKCKYCDRVSIGRSEYELHVLYDHPWQCNKCYHRFGTLSQLTQHVMLDMKTLPALSCTKCKLCFPSIMSIITHMGKLHREEESLYNCTNKEILSTYLLKSKSNCSCTCKVCDEGFTCMEFMISHVQKVHFTKVIFNCGVCKESKRLHVRSSLDGHQHFNSVSKQDIQFCYQCCLLFPNKRLSSKHMVMHQGVVTDSTKSKLKSVLKDKGVEPESPRIEAENLAEDKHEGKDDSAVFTKEMLDKSIADIIRDSAAHKGVDMDHEEMKSGVEQDIDDSRTTISATEEDVKDIEEDPLHSQNSKPASFEAGLECSECKLGPFNSRYQLKQHKVIKHLYPRHRTSTSYYQHVLENLKRPKAFECGKCERRFERQTSLFRHQMSHGMRRYSCQFADCKMKFGSVNALRLHQSKCRQKHRTSIGGRISCGNSDTSIDRTDGTGQAMGKFANVYICKLCEKDCENLIGLKEHIVTDHSGQLNQCNDCEVTYIKDVDEDQHTCSKDDNETVDGHSNKSPLKDKKRRLYSCTGCNKSFFKLMKLTKHVWEHEQDKKSGNDSESNTVKSGSDTAIELVGTTCSTAESESDLTGTVHTDSVENGAQVEQTDNSELNRKQVEKVKELSTEGWFRCSVCKKVFKESADLYQHVKAHLSPTSAASMARNKLLHAQSVQGDPSQPPVDLKIGGGENDGAGNSDSKVLNAVICNLCKRIVYFEEGKLCDVVLNHSCSDGDE